MSISVKGKSVYIEDAVMTEVILDIKQWGNNLGVRLLLAVAREANLKAHQSVRLTVTTPEHLGAEQW